MKISAFVASSGKWVAGLKKPDPLTALVVYNHIVQGQIPTLETQAASPRYKVIKVEPNCYRSRDLCNLVRKCPPFGLIVGFPGHLKQEASYIAIVIFILVMWAKFVVKCHMLGQVWWLRWQRHFLYPPNRQPESHPWNSYGCKERINSTELSSDFHTYTMAHTYHTTLPHAHWK